MLWKHFLLPGMQYYKNVPKLKQFFTHFAYRSGNYYLFAYLSVWCEFSVEFHKTRWKNLWQSILLF